MKGVGYCQMKKYQKSFPADTTLQKDENGKTILTFLCDPKVDGELYAYLLSLSIGEDKETRTYKSNLLPVNKIATDILNIKSRQTVYNHLNYLLEQGYIEDKGDYYRINNTKEKMYFNIPNDLIIYFQDVVKQPVIKIYIYLGQRNNYKPNQYVFTIKEICEHLGLSYAQERNRTMVKNCLQALIDFKLISITYFYEGKAPKMRLTNFTAEKTYEEALQQTTNFIF